MDAELQSLPIGKGEVMREGDAAAIFAIGNEVWPSMQAAEILAKEGIEVAVINARFIKPLDDELIAKYCTPVHEDHHRRRRLAGRRLRLRDHGARPAARHPRRRTSTASASPTSTSTTARRTSSARSTTCTRTGSRRRVREFVAARRADEIDPRSSRDDRSRSNAGRSRRVH